jgi:hypothetical protein
MTRFLLVQIRVCLTLLVCLSKKIIASEQTETFEGLLNLLNLLSMIALILSQACVNTVTCCLHMSLCSKMSFKSVSLRAWRERSDSDVPPAPGGGARSEEMRAEGGDVRAAGLSTASARLQAGFRW